MSKKPRNEENKVRHALRLSTRIFIIVMCFLFALMMCLDVVRIRATTGDVRTSQPVPEAPRLYKSDQTVGGGLLAGIVNALSVHLLPEAPKWMQDVSIGGTWRDILGFD